MSSQLTYPGPLDSPETLLSALGSLWDTTYQGNDLIAAICGAILAQQKQTLRNGRELLKSVSRKTVPVFHIENWYDLTLTQSQMGADDSGLAKFGDAGLVYNLSGPLAFGIAQTSPPYIWTLPESFVAAPLLFNRIASPSVTLIAGIDFTLQNGTITFRENPFINSAIPKATIFQDNVPVDQTLELWAYRGEIDKQNVYNQFGYALGLDLPSSYAYRDLVNAVFDALVLGGTSQAVQQAWSAVTGVPLTKTNGEIVEIITVDSVRTLIVTDQNTYEFSPTANVIVELGQQLSAGDPLTDGLRFTEFTTGACPDDLLALSLGPGLLAPGFFGDLTFQNQDTPLVVSYDADGNTEVTFAIGGWPGDIEAFFEQLQARGLARGKTLAQLLDQRPLAAQDTPPTAGSLPATINPLEFLCENVLRNNMFLVRLNPAAALAGAGTGVDAVKILRKILPPQTAMLILTSLTYSDVAIIMDGPGSDTTPGYEESLSVFVGVNYAESLSPSLVTENTRLYQIGGRCV